MGFVERELGKLGSALDGGIGNPRYPEIYAAQMALSYALDPSRFTSPSDYFSVAEGLPEKRRHVRRYPPASAD